MPQHPTKQATPPAKPPKHKITQKASQTADLNCLNFKLAVPPPQQGHTQNSYITRPNQPSILLIPKKAGPQTHKN